MGMKSRIYKEILVSLRKNPENWAFDKHTARHKQLPIEIWISNRFYGTRWTYGAIRSTHEEVDSLWWAKPWQWWRVTLVKAVEAAQYKVMDKHI